MPDLVLMLWFDLTPKTPLEWGVQPAELWVTAIAYQNAFHEGQEIERESHRARQATKQG